jgi:ubiquinone/menaquinone biosynthesis C-methylase UbiE
MKRKPVGTREWCDFVGHLTDALPGLHLGGQGATRTLLDACQADATSRVLDVGCGSGATACLIAEQYSARVRSIDISEVMIAKAEERARRQGLQERVEFQVADVFRLPFEDGAFDVAIVESVLIPLPGDKKQALAEMTRVVRPGGRRPTRLRSIHRPRPSSWRCSPSIRGPSVTLRRGHCAACSRRPDCT